MLFLRRLAAALVGVCLLTWSTSAQQGGAWRELFAADSLAGWEGDGSHWSMQGGVLSGRSSAEQPLDTTTYLVWRGGELGNFELELEYKLVGGNSGVQLRSSEAAPLDVRGLQADLEDGPDWTGGLYEQGGRGVLVRRGEQVHARADGQRSALSIADAQALQASVSQDRWNQYRIVALGPCVEVWLNGQRSCALVDEDPEHFRASGLLALQLHQGAPMTVQFRKLRVREFDSGAALTASAPGAAIAARSEAQWIWSSTTAAERERRWFRRSFVLEQACSSGQLYLRGDDHARLVLDGVELASNHEWWNPLSTSFERELARGEHVLGLEAWNDASAAAVMSQIELHPEGGVPLVIGTDGSWRWSPTEAPGWAAPGFDAVGWRTVHSFGGLEANPWQAAEPLMRGALAPEEPVLEARSIKVPPGFEVELVYEVPRERMGSWVCLTRDARGRFYASAQSGSIWRLSLDSEGRVAAVDEVPLPVGNAQGLLWAFDALYAVVNGGEDSGLWRLSDSDGDERLDRAEKLRAFDADGEHGPHAVVLGPDGDSLYVVAGNFTPLPEPLARWRVPQHYAEDQLLEHRNDPNGHDPGLPPPGGWVCRTDRNGTEWELVSAGMRNAYDIAFAPDGELYTYDSDMEWDIGLPWYRPTRICQLVSGVDFGWRNGNGKWPAWAPDSLPPVVELGLGSPTGVLHGAGLHAFPAEWQTRLFAADWAYGKVYAVDLEAQGAGHRGAFAVFAEGRPLPVADLEAGADGQLYLLAGGRGTQSALYRVRWSGTAQVPPATHATPNAAARERLALEQFHGRVVAGALDALWPALDSGDPYLANAARVALESQPREQWERRALDETRPRARMQVLIALLHTQAEGMDSAALWERALQLELALADPLLLAQRLRTLQLCCVRLGLPEGALRARLLTQLASARGHGDARARCAQAELCAVLGTPDAVELGLAGLEGASSQEEQIAFVCALAEVRADWSRAQAERLRAWVERPASRAGGASFDKFLAGVLAELAPVLALEPGKAQGAAAAATDVGRTAASVGARHAWTVLELEPYLEETRRGRNYEAGRALFASTTCATCHRLGNSGGATGPDLTGAGSRFSPRDLAEAVLEPSKIVSDQYQDTLFELSTGQLLSGRLLREDATSVQLLAIGPPEVELTIPPSLIETRTRLTLSRMPSGLLDGLDRQQLLDLFAYVLCGDNPQDTAFRP